MREGLEKTHQDSPDSPGRPQKSSRESVPASEGGKGSRTGFGRAMGPQGLRKCKNSEAKVKTSEGRQPAASSRWKPAPSTLNVKPTALGNAGIGER